MPTVHLHHHLNLRQRGELPVQLQHRRYLGQYGLRRAFLRPGVYAQDKEKEYYDRTVVWFRAYPFSLTVLDGIGTGELPLTHTVDGISVPTRRQPRFTYIAESLDDLDYSNEQGESLEGGVDLDLELVYVRSERRFYLTEIDNKIYIEWHNIAFDDCEYYNTEDVPTHALEDGIWGCEQDSRYYRYNSATGEIEPLPMLRYATSGLHELWPAVLFPGAKHQAVLERKRLSSVFY